MKSVEEIRSRIGMNPHADSLASVQLNKELHEAKKEGRRVPTPVKREARRELAIEEANQKLRPYGIYLMRRSLNISVPSKELNISEARKFIRGLQDAIALSQRIPSGK